MHCQAPQGGVSDGPKRTQVGVADAPEQANQGTRQVVAEACLRRERAGLMATQDARANNQLRPAGDYGRDESVHLGGEVTVVTVEEDHDVARLKRLQPGQTGLAVTPARLADHPSAASGGHLGGGVGRAVVDDHDFVDPARDLGEHPPDRGCLVEGRNDDTYTGAIKHCSIARFADLACGAWPSRSAGTAI